MLALAVAYAAALLMLGGGSSASASAASPDPPQRKVIVAIVPSGVGVEKLAASGDLAPGIVSSGLGLVRGAQTYLDISQGNRVSQVLYDQALPTIVVEGDQVPRTSWDKVRDRADNAPAEIIPGLLASTLQQAGVDIHIDTALGQALLIGVDRDGHLPGLIKHPCEIRCPAGLTLVRARTAQLPGYARQLKKGDLLIAITGSPPPDGHLLAIGIKGEGFGGDLTSDSTRTDGVVTSTDIAPTILDRLGVSKPDQMNGSVVRSEGASDAADVAHLQRQLTSRPNRTNVAILPLVAWLLLVGLAAAALRGRGARLGFELFGLCCVSAPSFMLLAVALDLGERGTGLLVFFGSLGLAIVARFLLPVGLALAALCGLTVGAHAIDVVLGSPLTANSVLGPNPAGGVRFYGIGNELEATLTTLTLVGTGAWLSWRREVAPRQAAVAFAAAAIVATAAFAPGRFGADVGAAIVLGAGAAFAIALSLKLSARATLALAVGAGLAGLAALVVADELLGGAHFTRSVLGADGPGALFDVFSRRVRLMVRTFVHPVYPQLLALTLVGLAVAIWKRDRVLGWFDGRVDARNGFLGALGGVVVGTFANDSGSVLLVIGSIYLAACVGYAWATIPRCASP